MNNRPRRALQWTLVFLLAVVALLLAGGLKVRAVVATSFQDAERIRAARLLEAEAVKQQLDEETGVRGYSAARDPVLLQPYFSGRTKLPKTLSELEGRLARLSVEQAMPLLRDQVETNRRWLRTIAFPLIVRKGTHKLLELRGKVLVDRFRDDGAAIDAVLSRRSSAVDARAQASVAAVGIFALLAILAVVLAATFFVIQQYGLGQRLQREHARAVESRRKSAELRVAYEAEKRTADTFREALALPALPALATVTLSATYEAASGGEDIGGDWYDVLELSESRGLLTIGDAAGHGIDAMVAMQKARQAVIAGALVDPRPDAVLRRANSLLANGPRMVTALVVLIEGRDRRFCYASAGHPPPVFIEPGKRARLLDVGALPLGLAAETSYQLRTVQAQPGAMLVLYTDGAIECSHDVPAGEAQLLEAVEAAAGGPASEAANSINAAIAGAYRNADDIAILTVRFD